jgi:hypothetical protein
MQGMDVEGQQCGMYTSAYARAGNDGLLFLNTNVLCCKWFHFFMVINKEVEKFGLLIC